jgi:hypothetical protein
VGGNHGGVGGVQGGQHPRGSAELEHGGSGGQGGESAAAAAAGRGEGGGREQNAQGVHDGDAMSERIQAAQRLVLSLLGQVMGVDSCLGLSVAGCVLAYSGCTFSWCVHACMHILYIYHFGDLST